MHEGATQMNSFVILRVLRDEWVQLVVLENCSKGGRGLGTPDLPNQALKTYIVMQSIEIRLCLERHHG